MAPNKRTKDKHLPPRVYLKHGAYYFVDKNNKWHFLGKNITEAMFKWTEMLHVPTTIYTMNQLFDRYILEVAPLKAPSTYKTNLIEIQRLRAVFGNSTPSSIEPAHIYRYLDKRSSQGAPIRANREKGLLSHVFSMSIKWGILKENPCREVSRNPEKPRDRYITDKEFLAVKEIATPLLRLAMDFAYLTALRETDILKVKLSDLREDGIFVITSKTKKKLIIEWTDELRATVKNIRQLKRNIKGLYLFSNHDGQPYTPSGFTTLWHRMMNKALGEIVVKENGKPIKKKINPVISERFQFRDIRRKAATDAEKLGGREYARQLLGHTTQQMTADYISGAQSVKALK